MTFTYASLNGKIISLDQAIVPVENINLQYGFGVYESLKVRKGLVYFAKQHATRLIQSARIIDLDHPFSKEQIQQYITDVVQKNAMDNGNIKVLLLGGKTPKESQLFILPLAPLFPDRKLYTQGAIAITVTYERFLPQAKTPNMLPSFLFFRQAQEKGAYDALLIDKKGNIREGTRTNFFVLQGNTLITPPKELVLDGVTRTTVIAIAKKNGFSIEEKEIPLEEINDCDGAFLTSTSSKIMPLRQIDTTSIPISDKVKELMKVYDAFLQTCQGIFE